MDGNPTPSLIPRSFTNSDTGFDFVKPVNLLKPEQIIACFSRWDSGGLWFPHCTKLQQKICCSFPITQHAAAAYKKSSATVGANYTLRNSCSPGPEGWSLEFSPVVSNIYLGLVLKILSIWWWLCFLLLQRCCHGNHAEGDLCARMPPEPHSGPSCRQNILNFSINTHVFHLMLLSLL